MSRTFLYCRTWPHEPNPTDDARAASSAGYEVEGRRIVAEVVKASVAATNRQAFAKLLDRLEAGDTLLVSSLDRIGCSGADALSTVHLLGDLGVHLVVLDLPDLTTKAGIGALAAVAQLDSAVRAERHPTSASIAPSKLGRKSSLNVQQKAELRALVASGVSARQAGKLFGVSHPTVLRVLADVVQK
jgi:putative DNA-invertase from lambdoid prophage Rac